jgi:hypothetical protein
VRKTNGGVGDLARLLVLGDVEVDSTAQDTRTMTRRTTRYESHEGRRKQNEGRERDVSTVSISRLQREAKKGKRTG